MKKYYSFFLRLAIASLAVFHLGASPLRAVELFNRDLGVFYEWEINDVEGTTGSDPGWDWLDLTEVLGLTAEQESFFTLGLANESDTKANFNALEDYTWVIAATAGGFADFDTELIALNVSDFEARNDTRGRTFSLENSGNDVYVQFAAIPEPRVYALLVGLFGLLVAFYYRRNGNAFE